MLEILSRNWCGHKGIFYKYLVLTNCLFYRQTLGTYLFVLPSASRFGFLDSLNANFRMMFNYILLRHKRSFD